jgi:hypothetical protein
MKRPVELILIVTLFLLIALIFCVSYVYIYIYIYTFFYENCTCRKALLKCASDSQFLFECVCIFLMVLLASSRMALRLVQLTLKNKHMIVKYCSFVFPEKFRKFESSQN